MCDGDLPPAIQAKRSTWRGSPRASSGCRPLPPDPVRHQFALLSRVRPPRRLDAPGNGSSARSRGSAGLHRGVVRAQVPLRQHLLKVAVAERESPIPADAQDDELVGEGSSPEQVGRLLLLSSPYQSLSARFATLPQGEPPHDGQELERHKREAVGCTLSAWVRK